jgi:cellulose synthase/poly-beta-1,6-N-acetylglucosamine synthase-like glycosyltransferase
MTAGAVVVLGLLAYAYFGYPVVIAVLARLLPARRAPASETPSDTLPTVSICLPVSEGAKYLPAKIESLLAQDYPADRIEILVYCDGCRDDSAAVAQKLAASPAAGGRIRVVAEAKRMGKPTGLNVLSSIATGELLLLNDVRQPLSPNAVRDLADALADPAIGCATGELVLTGGAGSGVYWRYERWIRAQESRFRGVPGMTGAIAMVRRADLVLLPEDLILDDVWIPMRLALAGKRVVVVDGARAFDVAFEDDREFRRKARTLSGNFQLFAYLPALLSPFKNPIWFETFSHKVLRLAAPWLMLALFMLSIGAAAGGDLWTGALLYGQIGFYLAAAVGRRAGPIGGLARTFVVLNAAAAVGLVRFLRGRVTW